MPLFLLKVERQILSLHRKINVVYIEIGRLNSNTNAAEAVAVLILVGIEALA
jgi:hypothetical protein